MYTIAEKYEIIDLKELALHKFTRDSRCRFANDRSYSTVDIALERTPENDCGLRHTIAKRIQEELLSIEMADCIEQKLQA
jgi:hypothetical protein